MHGFGRGAVVGFVAGAAVGAGGAYLVLSQVRPAASSGGSDIKHHALEHGMPRTEAIRVNEGYVAAFDFRTRNPKWVLEHITAETSNGAGDRKESNFFEDPDLEPWLRSKLEDYWGSGYDRGHMAPAANHKGSQKAMDETFNLCNISPQVGEGFNRDYWARFEKFVKDVTRKSEDVWIVTGPLWLPRPAGAGQWEMNHQMIGRPPSLVSVPTHFFKVVLAKGMHKKDGKAAAGAGSPDTAVAAFVMPNARIDPETPLSAFVVPLEPLESIAGTRFFPQYLSKERVQGLDDRAQSVRTDALARMKLLDRQQLLESVPHRLALPAPGTLNITETVQPPSVAQVSWDITAADQGATQAPAAPAKAVRGCAHLCEVLACRLPPERFWERGNSGKSKRDNASGGGGGNRALTRR